MKSRSTLQRGTSLKTLIEDKKAFQHHNASQPLKREFKINRTPKLSSPYLLDQLDKSKGIDSSNIFLESRPRNSLSKPPLNEPPVSTPRLNRVSSTKLIIHTTKHTPTCSTVGKEFFRPGRISAPGPNPNDLSKENRVSATNIPLIPLEKIQSTPTYRQKKQIDDTEITPTATTPRIFESSSKIYLLNKEKYLPKNSSFGYPNSPRRPDAHNDEIFDLNWLKEELKFKKRNVKAAATTTPYDIISRQKFKAIQELKAEMQKSNVTKEDEIKIAILKKKIAINTMLGVELKADNEEKKAIYKNLLLEYHPDKRKHEKEVSEEIFNYLLSNRNLFIDGAAA